MDHQRPQGFRFAGGGVNLKDPPDNLKPTKYACAKNVRWSEEGSVRTRPGWTEIARASTFQPIIDMQSFVTLETDAWPRILARDQTNYIHLLGPSLSSNTVIGQMSGPDGYGASMLPFRPSASPQSWMYVATGGNTMASHFAGDYQKFQAPDANNNCVQHKVGIAEPQQEIQASEALQPVVDFTNQTGNWTFSAPAGSTMNNSVHPVNDFINAHNFVVGNNTIYTGVQTDRFATHRRSIRPQSDDLYNYAVNELVKIGGIPMPIEEVWPAIPNTTVQAIYYEDANTCVIVPASVPSGALGRGSTVLLQGSEVVLVEEVMDGPGGISFRVYTTLPHVAGENITGIDCFVVCGPATAGPNNNNTAIISDAVRVNIPPSGAGNNNNAVTIQLSQSWAGNDSPFAGYSDDDYAHFSVNLGDTSFVTSATVNFDVGNAGAAAFSNVISYPIPLTDLTQGGLYNAISVPLAQLTNFGGGDIRSAKGIQLEVVTVGWEPWIGLGSLWAGGGYNPDIGLDGVPYQYRVVPRCSLTGVVGNPSPTMRYGVTAHRQQITLTLPDRTFLPDWNPATPVVDTWDIYRYGGTVTSYQYIGSAPAQNGYQNWIDNVSDAAAQAGQPLETDNFEPWVSIDIPATIICQNNNNNNIVPLITLVGDTLTMPIGNYPTTVFPLSMNNWLPGTLLTIHCALPAGNNNFTYATAQTYTLRTRPGTLTANNAFAGYTMYLEESGGGAVASKVIVQEPLVAHTPVPYMWGPDDFGTVFAVGDVLRPGTLYFAKPYKPDQAPDVNTIELTPPSEPLIGGRCINGVCYAASTNRWWAMHTGFIGPSAYQQLSQPVGRAPVGPFAMADDGKAIYFWAKDGIVMTDGGPYKSLTDEDLYPLFPHEGVDAVDIVRNGVTYYAPDYANVATFRLEHFNGFLYATYQDRLGHYRTLVLDLHKGAWVYDDFLTDTLKSTTYLGIKQQAGGLWQGPGRYLALLMADDHGFISQQTDNMGDWTTTNQINCTVATFQFDGGDQRSRGQWGDVYLDASIQGPAGLTVTPFFETLLGNGTPVVLPPGPAPGVRQMDTITLQGAQQAKFLGLQFDWSDW
jgi:hypothetical protein